MSKVKAKNVENTVKELLINCEQSRESDLLLYQYYIMANQYSLDMRVSNLFSLIEKGILPNFDSVSRARRKVQNKERKARANGTFSGETVLPSAEVEQYRANEEKEHRKYYSEGNLVFSADIFLKNN